MGIGTCVNASAFNNFLHDVFALDIGRRAFLELPRELPGFLVAILTALLATLGDVRMAAFANLIDAIGIFALGVIPPVFGLMVMTSFCHVRTLDTRRPF